MFNVMICSTSFVNHTWGRWLLRTSCRRCVACDKSLPGNGCLHQWPHGVMCQQRAIGFHGSQRVDADQPEGAYTHSVYQSTYISVCVIYVCGYESGYVGMLTWMHGCMHLWMNACMYGYGCHPKLVPQIIPNICSKTCGIMSW